MSRLRILILLKKFTAVLYTVHTTAFFFWVLWTVSGNGDGFGRQHLVNGVGIVTRTISFCSCDTKATTQGISPLWFSHLPRILLWKRQDNRWQTVANLWLPVTMLFIGKLFVAARRRLYGILSMTQMYNLLRPIRKAAARKRSKA